MKGKQHQGEMSTKEQLKESEKLNQRKVKGAS